MHLSTALLQQSSYGGIFYFSLSYMLEVFLFSLGVIIDAIEVRQFFTKFSSEICLCGVFGFSRNLASGCI
jgi:hypothetical protein